MKKSILLLFFAAFFADAFSQQPVPIPCSENPVYRQFDFWVGEWEAFNPQGRKGGDSKIERILDSCVILESWTATQGNYSGKSYNTIMGQPVNGSNIG